MGQKPKDRSTRLKSMDALLAQSKRDSDRPHAGRVKFEVRDRTEAANANEDPRGWLFSGRPPALSDVEEQPTMGTLKFRVQQDAGAGGEDPRGWLFSGRPDAVEDADAVDDASPSQSAGGKAAAPRRRGVPAPVAKLDLVKKRKKRKKSGEHELVPGDEKPATVQPVAAMAVPDDTSDAGADDAGSNDDAGSQPQPQPQPQLQLQLQLQPQLQPQDVDAPPLEHMETESGQEDSDPTLQVATPSAEDDELNPPVTATDLDLETPQPQVPETTSRTPALLLTALFVVGSGGAAWYIYQSGGAGRAGAPDEQTQQSDEASRRMVAFAKRAQKSEPPPPTPIEEPKAPVQEPKAPVQEPKAEVPPAETVTEIDVMTPEQQAMSDEARVKEARYMRARGFRAIRQNKLDKAEESFRQSLQLYPDSSVSLRGLGETLLLKGEKGRARAWLGRALRRSPADKETQALLDKLRND